MGLEGEITWDISQPENNMSLNMELDGRVPQLGDVTLHRSFTWEENSILKVIGEDRVSEGPLSLILSPLHSKMELTFSPRLKLSVLTQRRNTSDTWGLLVIPGIFVLETQAIEDLP